MASLNGQPGHLQFTVTITRNATGAVETYNMVGYVEPDKVGADPQAALERVIAPILKPESKE